MYISRNLNPRNQVHAINDNYDSRTQDRVIRLSCYKKTNNLQPGFSNKVKASPVSQTEKEVLWEHSSFRIFKDPDIPIISGAGSSNRRMILKEKIRHERQRNSEHLKTTALYTFMLQEAHDLLTRIQALNRQIKLDCKAVLNVLKNETYLVCLRQNTQVSYKVNRG